MEGSGRPSGDCLSGLSRPSAGAGPVQQQPRASLKLSTKKPRLTGQARAASVALRHDYTGRAFGLKSRVYAVGGIKYHFVSVLDGEAFKIWVNSDKV